MQVLKTLPILIILCFFISACSWHSAYRNSLKSRDAYIEGKYLESKSYLETGNAILKEKIDKNPNRAEWVREAYVMQEEGGILISEQLGNYREAAEVAAFLLNSPEMNSLDPEGCLNLHGNFIKALNLTRLGDLDNARLIFKQLVSTVGVYESRDWEDVDGYRFVRLIFKSAKKPHWWYPHGNQLIGLSFFLEGQIDSAMYYTRTGYDYWQKVYASELLIPQQPELPLDIVFSENVSSQSKIGDLTGMSFIGPKLFDISKGAIATNYFVGAQLCNNMAFGALEASRQSEGNTAEALRQQSREYLQLTAYYMVKGDSSLPQIREKFYKRKKKLEQAGWKRLQGRFMYNKGKLALAEKDTADAISYYLEGSQVWDSLYRGLHPDLAIINNELGDVYQARNQRDSARIMYKKALGAVSLAAQKDSDKEYLRLPETVLSLQNFAHNQALNFFEDPEKVEDGDEALRAYLESARIIQNLSSDFHGLKSKVQLLEKFISDYQEGVKLGIALYQQTASPKYQDMVFQLMESNRASLLNERVRNIGQQYLEGKEELKALVARANALSEESYFAEVRSFTPEEITENDAYDTIITNSIKNRERIRRDRAEVDSLIRLRYPNYKDYTQTPAPLGLDEFRKRIPENVGTIQYFWGGESLFMFGLSGRSSKLMEATLSLDSIEANIFHIKNLLSYNPGDKRVESNFVDLYKNFYKASSELYDELVRPFWEEWKTQGIEELVFFQDGNLHSLPMEVLIQSQALDLDDLASADWELDYLIRDVAVSYESSPALYGAYPYQGNPQHPYLGIAPPYNPLLGYSKSRSEELYPEEFQQVDFKALPHTKEEVNKAAKLFDGRTLTSEAETTEAYFKEIVAPYQILHFAMHGVLSTYANASSGLVFQQSEDNRVDDILFAHEIIGLPLNAEMVVLSACETGLGNYMVGEGVLSMARAFRAAGCPSVMMTLWKVSADGDNPNFLRTFFEHIKNGENKSQALRMAKLSFLQSGKTTMKHPHFWAPFVLTGNSDPLDIISD
ncbi:MAG: CHAT domain-containing protein [Bacteroidia bacterium]|nr:CHAT domain-containing protein [Bacteroidia bacterium]